MFNPDYVWRINPTKKPARRKFKNKSRDSVTHYALTQAPARTIDWKLFDVTDELPQTSVVKSIQKSYLRKNNTDAVLKNYLVKYEILNVRLINFSNDELIFFLFFLMHYMHVSRSQKYK